VVEFSLVYEEDGVDTMFYKAREILWEVCCCYVLLDDPYFLDSSV
jgi:hypothetical protein